VIRNESRLVHFESASSRLTHQPEALARNRLLADTSGWYVTITAH
jgi:hypothetical protein